MTEATPFLPCLSLIGGKEITATFDGGQLSSDGGVLILREIEKRLGLARAISRHVPDMRDPGRIVHTYDSMIQARVFAIASGYEDCDDLDALRIDPVLKMACGRKPGTGDDLMSQPTLSRLENAPSWRALARMTIGMIDMFCASFPHVPGRIVLDIDDTDDLAHGQQELILFNTHSGGYCFQPIHIFEAGTGKPVLSLLRPGKRPSGEEAAQVLRHVIARIRKNWPRVEITVRGDSHYAAPEVLDLLEEKRCGYILGLSTNARLAPMAQPWAEDAATRRALSKKEKVRRFHQAAYQAGSWSKSRKIIARAEATDMGSDVRFVVTNLPGAAKVLYDKVYCARGRMENMIKDMKLYTRSDRTSCHRWEANQFR
ncbi:MAG: IS1380 family transposase, partial [Rhodomicrobium sp.]